ncbi:MAG: hypothetical protein ACYTG1_01100 [Planctomycetota bacterium]
MLFVSLSLADPEKDLGRVAPRMQEVLQGAPGYGRRFFIGADVFGELDPALAAYRSAD